MQHKILLLPLLLVYFTFIMGIQIETSSAWAQEIKYSTFQEIAQLVIDNTISQNVTASITLQSTNTQEIKISAELEKSIREDNRVKAVVLTNQKQCVLGVINESCIMINIQRDPKDKGIIEIQDSTREISDQYINKINQAFDTNAVFHSVFVHSDDTANKALKTSGVISGRGMISAVYTVPREDTDSMYEKISGILISKTIREGGGFYKVAKELSANENSKMTFSLIPADSKSLMQLKLSVDYPNQVAATASTSDISPLEFFNIKNINRSNYFSTGFYPLNSIVQIVVLSPENSNISDVKGDILKTQIIDDEKIPTDISKQGWVFDPKEGQRIQGKYIFGKETSINNKELEFSVRVGVGEGETNLQTDTEGFDESVIIVAIITVVAIVAAVFYLKGYKK